MGIGTEMPARSPVTLSSVRKFKACRARLVVELAGAGASIEEIGARTNLKESSLKA
jgi:hypothetical protein